MKDAVTIELKKDDALVLFDLLSGWQEREVENDLSFKNGSQKHALFGLLAKLEEILAEPFMPDYGDLVRMAEQNLIERYGQF